jgi:hypothetical protein
MLYEEGYTIEGVKRYWVRRRRVNSRKLRPREIAKKVMGDLRIIIKILDSHA